MRSRACARKLHSERSFAVARRVHLCTANCTQPDAVTTTVVGTAARALPVAGAVFANAEQ